MLRLTYWYRILTVIAALSVGFAGGFARADDTQDGVYIIYDSSNSMWGALPDQSRKYEAARVAMRELVGEDFDGRSVALRMYGHRRKDDCSDSELVVPFSDPATVRGDILAAMDAVRPTGRTPIDLSLRQALDDFGDRAGAIILISDGIESCDADPCALVRAWRDRNVSITVHVVGLGLKGQERAAMQCIAEAAGTEYRDAFSADELAETLQLAVAETAAEVPKPETSDSAIGAATSETPERGTPDPAPQEMAPDFKLVVETADGVRQKGAGTLTPVGGGDPIPVETFMRHTPEPGDYLLVAGLRVIGGDIYTPVTQTITVATSGRTTATIVAPRPPEASAAFSMEGEALRATMVTVFRGGKKLGSFTGDETAFVPEGALDFSAKPVGTSERLTVKESFGPGDTKTVRFDAATEVHLRVDARATGSGEQLKGKPATQLMVDGVEVDTINNSSGGLVRPGDYVLLIDDGLNRFETPISVSADPEQVLQLEVPAGAVKVRYVDTGGTAEAAKRVFLQREGGRRVVRTSDQAVALVPGRYIVIGWPKKSAYPDQMIEVAAGDTLEVVLRATK